MAAMAEAAKDDAPALGLYYLEDRPTLSDVMDTTARHAENR
jgi:hypothetical protein